MVPKAPYIIHRLKINWNITLRLKNLTCYQLAIFLNTVYEHMRKKVCLAIMQTKSIGNITDTVHMQALPFQQKINEADRPRRLNSNGHTEHMRWPIGEGVAGEL